MAGHWRRVEDDKADAKSLRLAIAISIALFIFSLLAHWLPMGSAPIGGSVFNQLTVAQFVGGVGGGIGAVIVGATLWLQNRALKDLRLISKASHQFEAYALWRAFDDSICNETIVAVANVLDALLAVISDGVSKDQDSDKINDEDRARDPEPLVRFWNINRNVRLTVLDNETVISYETVAKELNTILLADLGRDTFKVCLQSGQDILIDDVRRARHLATRFLLHLDEAERLECEAQCVGLISNPTIQQYFDILVRIRSNSAAIQLFASWIQRDSENRIDNMLVGSVVWGSDDVKVWQRQGEQGRGQ